MGDKLRARSEIANIFSGARLLAGERVLLAHLYISLDDLDAAVTQLEQAYKMRTPTLLRIKVSPPFDRLRSLPRFKALIRQMNFE